MILYRLAIAQYAEDLSGTGAKTYGGRWNPPGTPVIYTSDSLALAILEVLANVPTDFLAQHPSLYHSVTLSVPDDVSISTIEHLPNNWRAFPAPVSLAKLGYAWASAGETLMLKVPSAVAGEGSWNYLINPLHPESAKLKILRHDPFTFDARLIGTEPPDSTDFEGGARKIKARKRRG